MSEKILVITFHNLKIKCGIYNNPASNASVSVIEGFSCCNKLYDKIDEFAQGKFDKIYVYIGDLIQLRYGSNKEGFVHHAISHAFQKITDQGTIYFCCCSHSSRFLDDYYFQNYNNIRKHQDQIQNLKVSCGGEYELDKLIAEILYVQPSNYLKARKIKSPACVDKIISFNDKIWMLSRNGRLYFFDGKTTRLYNKKKYYHWFMYTDSQYLWLANVNCNILYKIDAQDQMLEELVFDISNYDKKYQNCAMNKIGSDLLFVANTPLEHSQNELKFFIKKQDRDQWQILTTLKGQMIHCLENIAGKLYCVISDNFCNILPHDWNNEIYNIQIREILEIDYSDDILQFNPIGNFDVNINDYSIISSNRLSHSLEDILTKKENGVKSSHTYNGIFFHGNRIYKYKKEVVDKKIYKTNLDIWVDHLERWFELCNFEHIWIHDALSANHGLYCIVNDEPYKPWIRHGIEKGVKRLYKLV